MEQISQPGLIGLDWGTSSLRGYLLAADGAVIEGRARPWGIQHLPAGGFAAALHGVAGDWRARWPHLPVLAAGMVGSRQGWHEVPYVDCPADLSALAAGIEAIDIDGGTLHLVPGLARRGSSPDVMRGEETQMIGALAREPGLAADSVFVLPGTHCKWAWIRDGRVERFTTYLTGELFALLRDHSIVGRPAREVGVTATGDATSPAFLHGVRVARESGAAGSAARLFTARSLYLMGELAVSDTLDYLSGLLVGEEIRSVVLGAGSCPPCLLLGDPALCSRYRAALGDFGVGDVRVLDETAPAGLWQIAVAAGLASAVPAGPPRHGHDSPGSDTVRH